MENFNALWDLNQNCKYNQSAIPDIMCAAQMEDGLTEWFAVQSGVRQGCILSPLLFVIVIDFVLCECSFSGVYN